MFILPVEMLQVGCVTLTSGAAMVLPEERLTTVVRDSQL
jgi:hypothetical protein